MICYVVFATGVEELRIYAYLINITFSCIYTNYNENIVYKRDPLNIRVFQPSGIPGRQITTEMREKAGERCIFLHT